MDNQKEKLAFDRINYMLLLAGLAVLAIGFILMSLDSEPHGFGFLGITLGPIVVVIGFIIELVAILYRSRK